MLTLDFFKKKSECISILQSSEHTSFLQLLGMKCLKEPQAKPGFDACRFLTGAHSKNSRLQEKKLDEQSSHLLCQVKGATPVSKARGVRRSDIFLPVKEPDIWTRGGNEDLITAVQAPTIHMCPIRGLPDCVRTAAVVYNPTEYSSNQGKK